MNQETHKPRPARPLPIQIPADLNPIYTNFALITHSRSEILIDFAQVMPQIPQARVKARMVMTPINAKLLLRALQEHLEGFEAAHGEIVIPEGNTLADQLFRPPAEGDQEGE
jgi:hypothetical protein